MRVLFLLLLLKASVWATQIAGEITLVNDSPYILTASVYAANGDFLGQQTLQPGSQNTFTTSVNSINYSRPGLPKTSLSPFRIVWRCPGGDVFSMCTDGSSGSYVRASGCPGLYTCTQKKEAAPPPAAGTSQK